MNLTGNTILITGGTSGIGRALAEAFHALGNQVIITGRREHLLNEITATHAGMHSIKVDMEDLSALDAFVAQIKEEFPQLNILINNAGISKPEDLTSDNIDLSVMRSMIDINILGVIQLTAALLPTLKQQSKSTIITTTSGLAFIPLSPYPTYCATKAFLHSWLQSLRFQLRNTAIEVLELAPPYVQTELSGPAQATDPAAMPLADYIAEVMQLLGNPNPPNGEILVERVKGFRLAESNGSYEQTFKALNNR